MKFTYLWNVVILETSITTSEYIKGQYNLEDEVYTSIHQITSELIKGAYRVWSLHVYEMLLFLRHILPVHNIWNTVVDEVYISMKFSLVILETRITTSEYIKGQYRGWSLHTNETKLLLVSYITPSEYIKGLYTVEDEVYTSMKWSKFLRHANAG